MPEEVTVKRKDLALNPSALIVPMDDRVTAAHRLIDTLGVENAKLVQEVTADVDSATNTAIRIQNNQMGEKGPGR